MLLFFGSDLKNDVKVYRGFFFNSLFFTFFIYERYFTLELISWCPEQDLNARLPAYYSRVRCPLHHRGNYVRYAVTYRGD